ncbi:glycosyltransferase family 2 protein [Cupriavidus pinatubonensis]|uniref:glycosyltransferase family 2 protein n=1 Tax=Cupriavidus pinatubonensis TaxID=248026 RepID=UPI001C7377A1|nr:glycosyltransferase family A protein [Cupriavidus pinatubonensis]QYY28559.1 glycosyltransferase family 2 protein [Cupriavidus pinatubonensis]
MRAPDPAVSVVIPTYRRPDLLERCLRALCAQDIDGGAYEVIVCDDGCEPRIAKLVEALAAEHPHRVLRYVAVSRTQGPAGARNAGAWRSRAGIVAFTDDDTIPTPAWVREGCRALAAMPAWSAASGRTLVPTPARPTDHERDTAGLSTAEFVTANCFVRRKALVSIGGFDERFTRAWREDSDLQFRLEQEVGPVGRAPDAVVVHPVRPAPWGSSIAAQAKVYFDALLYKKHPALYRTRIRRFPPWQYYVIGLAVVVAVVAALAGAWRVAGAAALLWSVLTAWFCARRLRGAALTPSHVAEMVVTSILIPPLSLYWRLRGALAFQTRFL